MSQLSLDEIDRIVQETTAQLGDQLRLLLGSIHVAGASQRTPEPLARAAHRLRSAVGQADALRSLLAAASTLGARAALFVVRTDHLEGWEGVGFEDDPALDGVLKGVQMGRDAACIVRALDERAPVPAAAGTDTPVPDFGQANRGEALLLPLVVAGNVAGLLYADPQSANEPIDRPGLETLVDIAGLAIERIVIAKSARATIKMTAPARPAQAARPAKTAAPASAAPPREHDTVAVPPMPTGDASDDPKGADALRFARLLMDEICLYNSDKVEEGREKKDIVARLGDEVERARRMYEERISASIRNRGDYFEQAMVAVLAVGDKEALGLAEKT
ncbi:MAG: hypothetical protein OEQ13_07190 [Acidobacteriota bacterium]|nr:hypothetical protein [Acidobacteriota bacterium]